MLTAEPQPRNETPVDVDHRFLRQALKWLRSAREQGAIKELLDDLGAYLARHFAAEEKVGGFFETVVQAAPRHAHVIGELRGEHQGLLADIEAIAKGLTKGPEPAPQDVLDAVATFITKMEQHEQREEGLLQATLDRDIGAGD